MAKTKKSSPFSPVHIINRKARHDYILGDVWEAGLQLMGTEVKSLRMGRGQLKDAYVIEKQGNLYAVGMHIAPYPFARHGNHAEERPRLLLLHKREINKIMGAMARSQMTAVVLEVYSNDKGLIKAKIATAQGKKKHDKRESEKERTWQRDKQRIMKGDG